MEPMTIRVFLADDHEVVRRGVRDLIDHEDDMSVVGEASNASEAMTRIPLCTPHVLKQVRGNELLDGIRRVAAGESLLDPSVTTRVLDRLRHADEDDLTGGLTGQESKILELLAEGLTNRQIAERMHLAEKTVKNYVSNLLAKLGMSRRTEAAVYAARMADRRER